MFMGLNPGSGVAMPQAQQMGNYIQNYERRRAIRGALYPPQGSTRVGRGAGGGMLAPMPGVGGYAGEDPGSIEATNSALQQIDPRLSEPTHINPFLLFHDQNPDGSPTWAGNHPGITRAIEGGLIGATTPPSNTPGEAISNISRTVLGIPGMYRANAQAQMDAPIQTATNIANLEKLHNDLEEQHARIDLQHAQTEYYQDRPTQGTAPHIAFNNDGEAVVWNPQTGQYEKHPELSGSPKATKTPSNDFQVYVQMRNAENASKGQPPLDSNGYEQAFKDFNKAKQRPLPPRVDPNLKFQVDNVTKQIAENQKVLDETEPKNQTDRMIFDRDTTPEGNARRKRYQDASDAIQKLKDKRDQLLQQHYQYSVSQPDNSGDDETDNSPIPQPIAPVRLPPGTTVQTDSGQPGTYSNGRIGPSQPGTTKAPKKKDSLGIL